MTNLFFQSVTQLAAQYRSGSVSPVDVMNSYIERYKEVNGSVNAFSFTFFEQALKQAEQAEVALQSNAGKALTGIAAAIKDETYIQGQITTNGSELLKEWVAQSTDPVAQRLIDSGAIVHGRTTTPEFSTSGVTWSNLWGVSRNPWNTNITCGGSSGGSAISVASGMTSFANGTDIGGSIRIPAAFCGVYGYKPAHGHVPEIAPYNTDLYCHHGLLTRSLEDLEYIYPLIKGSDWQDSHSFVPDAPINKSLDQIKNLKVAVSKDLGFYQVEDDILDALDNTVKALKAAGAEVEYVDLDWDQRVITTAKTHQRMLMGQLLQRHWDKPEHHAKLTSYVKHYFAKVNTLTTADILDANLYQNEMWQSLSQVFKHFDVMLCPTLATTKIPAQFDYSKDSVQIKSVSVDANKGWFMTYPFNTFGQCPVLSMPNGTCENGVPSSVQIVGRPYQEQGLFTVARALSRTVAADFYQHVFPDFSAK